MSKIASEYSMNDDNTGKTTMLAMAIIASTSNTPVDEVLEHIEGVLRDINRKIVNKTGVDPDKIYMKVGSYFYDLKSTSIIVFYILLGIKLHEVGIQQEFVDALYDRMHEPFSEKGEFNSKDEILNFLKYLKEKIGNYPFKIDISKFSTLI